MTGVGYFYLCNSMLMKSGGQHLIENVSPRSGEKQEAPESACFQRHFPHPAMIKSGDRKSQGVET